MKITFLVIFFFIFFISCEKEQFSDFNETRGILSKDSVNIAEFDSLIIKNVFDVYLFQDTVNYIVIEGIKNLAKNVKIEIINNTLTLDTESKYIWTKPNNNKIKITIHFKNISKIDIREASRTESINEISGNELGIILNCKIAEVKLKLNHNIFYFWNNRGGVLELEGNVNELKIWNFALSNIFAGKLISDKVIIENHSLGDCEIGLANHISGGIFNKGNIYYKGNPIIENFYTDSNSGKLIKEN